MGFQRLGPTDNVLSATATALTVARAGSNYGLQVDESTANAATGLKITPAAAAAGLALAVISSGTNENLTLNAKGSGTIGIGTVSTGLVTAGSAVSVTGTEASALANAAAAQVRAGVVGGLPMLQLPNATINYKLYQDSDNIFKIGIPGFVFFQVNQFQGIVGIYGVTNVGTGYTNQIALNPANSGSPVIINPTGETNIGVTVQIKGTGTLTLSALGTGSVAVGVASDKLGMYGATPVTRAAAITAPANTASTQTTPFGYTTSAQADAIVTAVRSIITALQNIGVTS